MQTKNILQASANVIRVTNLPRGDIYKRFNDSSYSKDVKLGIVRNIYNDGESTYVEAVKYKKSYRDLEASIYVIRGDNDVSIFSATIEEIQEEFSDADAEAGIIKSIADKSEEVRKLEQALETTQQLINGKLQQKPQTPTFKEVTQAEFNQKVREREALTLDWAHPYPIARAPQKKGHPEGRPLFHSIYPLILLGHGRRAGRTRSRAYKYAGRP